MDFGIEFRSPFTDHMFIEAAFSIESKLKEKYNTQKYILKKILKKKHELKRKKQLFSAPYIFFDFSTGYLKNLFLDLINNNSKLSEFYDIKGVKKLLNAHSSDLLGGPNDHSNTLTKFLCLELFLRSRL